MQRLEAQKETGERPRETVTTPPLSTPLLDTWLKAYQEGDKLFSQTTAATTIFIGEAVMLSMRDGKTTWEDFIASTVSVDQMKALMPIIRDLHRAFGIDKIPQEYMRPERGEKPLNTNQVHSVYGSAKSNIVSGLYALFNGATSDKIKYPIEQVAPSVGDSLRDHDKLAMAVDLFSVAASTIRGDQAAEIGSEHRRNFQFRKLGVPSREITREEEASLKVSVAEVLTMPLLMAGRRHHLDDRRITAFQVLLEGSLHPEQPW